MLLELVSTETSITGRLIRMERGEPDGALLLSILLDDRDRLFMVPVENEGDVRPAELAERLGTVIELIGVAVRRPDTMAMVAFRCVSLGGSAATALGGDTGWEFYTDAGTSSG